MKRFLILVLLLFCAGSLLATQNRVASMGGEVGILPDDDANIGLFPQRVNDWTIARFEGVNTNTPDYLLVVGKKGKKWGFFGGQNEEDYFFNVIKGLSTTSAISLGLRLNNSTEEITQDNNESSPINMSSEESMKLSNMEIDVVYGTDMGDAELAIAGYYMSGPGYMPVGYGYYYYPFGTYSLTQTMGTTSDTEEGEAKVSQMGVGLAYRAPMSFLIFDNIYLVGGYQSGKSTAEYSDEDATLVETEEKLSMIGADVYFFNSKKITGGSKITKSVNLVYALGAGFGTLSYSYENKLDDEDLGFDEIKEESASEMLIGGPRVRIGVEADLSIAKLRFGVQRDINFYYSGKDEITYAKSGFEDGADTEEWTIKGIGQFGSYTFASGVGFELGRFTLNLLLNNTFWCTGPQMFFNSVYGTWGASADVIVAL